MPEKPWQNGSIYRAVFDEYLNKGIMEIVRDTVERQIGETLKKIKASIYVYRDSNMKGDA